ncbi:alpha/beta hydrolase [Chitinimonas taiwanensis]|uniref:alpha/beta hydrolase n=1 Tax=Chitinimonas taiwanensis TaxID=240412 RepID=UPI0035B46F78
MSPLFARGLSALMLFCGLGLSAQAGPLRDWLAERRTAAEAELASDEASGGPYRAVAGVRVLRDLAYGASERERFDVYLPTQASPRWVIVMVHGGAWRAGDKAARPVVQNKIARWVPRGAVLVSLNYPLLPEAGPLQQAQAVARGMAAVQQRANAWGVDASQLVLIGHSAGAHLVALLSASPKLAQEAGAAPWLGSVVLDSAGLDMVGLMQGKHYRFHERAFGADPAYWQATSPYHQLSREAVPMLITCSTERADQPCTAAQRFASRAQTLGVTASVHAAALSHRQMNDALGLPGAYTDAVEAFLSQLVPSWSAAL